MLKNLATIITDTCKNYELHLINTTDLGPDIIKPSNHLSSCYDTIEPQFGQIYYTSMKFLSSVSLPQTLNH